MDNRSRYKKILREETHLPENLSWEDMNGGIIKRMKQLDNADKPKRRLPILLLFLLSGVGIAALVFQNRNSIDVEDSIVPSIVNEQNTVSNESHSRASRTDAISEGVHKPKKEIKNQTASQVASTTDPTLLATEIPKKPSRKKVKKLLSFVPQVAEETSNPLRNTDSVHETLTRDSNASSGNLGLLPQPVKNSSDTLRVAYLARTASLLSWQERPERLISPRFLSKRTEQPNAKRASEKASHSILLAGGAHHWLLRHNGNSLAEAKSAHEKGVLGYGAKLQYQYHINNKWGIITGLRYQEKVTRFEYEATLDTIVHQDVTQVLVNTISGAFMSQRTSNKPFAAQLWENVIHYNIYRSVSIPLLVNRKFQLSRRSRFSIAVGPELNIIGTAKGRTLRHYQNNEFLFRSKYIKSTDHKISGVWSGLSSAAYHYQLSKGFDWTTGLDFQVSLTDLDSHEANVLRTYNVFAFTGIRYRF